MKTKKITNTISAFLALIVLGLLYYTTNSKITNDITTEISLPTVQCGMCDRTISKALDKVNGIKNYEVDIENKRLTITFDDALTTIADIEAAISKAGYQANDKAADKTAYDKLHSCCKLPKDR